MQIKIKGNFIVTVPHFTDELDDLKQLFEDNFGGWQFTNADYEHLNRLIVFSKNTNWDKAIALTILNQKLISKAIYKKVNVEDYPYFKYPYIRFSHKITYIVETLAINVLKKLKHNLKESKYNCSTFIINSVEWSFTQEQDYLIGNAGQIRRIKKCKQQRDEERQQFQQWKMLLHKYKDMYGRPDKNDYADRLHSIRLAIARLNMIHHDSMKEIRLIKKQLNWIDEIESSAKKALSTSPQDYFELQDELPSLNEKSKIYQFAKIWTKHDFENAKFILKNDLEEYQREIKLTKSLSKLKKEKKMLEIIVKDYPEQKKHFSDFVFMENLELLEPEKLNQIIDNSAYYFPNPTVREDYFDLKKEIDYILNTINDREANSLALRYLIPKTLPKEKANFCINQQSHVRTLEEIGQIYGYKSRERIRQIIAKGLRKLRHPSRSNSIMAFYNGRDLEDQINGIIDEHNILPCDWKK